VVFGFTGPSFLIIGALDTLGAIWTWLSLRAETQASTVAA
jgi:hypothetical protein